MSRDRQLCNDILPRVSRSFSLCIRILPEPLRQQMMLSYLTYRIIDTIEDSSAPLAVKKSLFDEFVFELSRRRMDEASFERLRLRLLTLISFSYEQPLFEHADSVVREYFRLPLPVRRPILRWGRVMADGMFEFQRRRIATFDDQDRYSFYVAGVVGYLYTDLLYANRLISLQLRRRLRTHARRFGLALQKVNILRDISGDIAQRRYYWPAVLLKKYHLSYATLCKEENRAAAMQVLDELVQNALDYLASGMCYVVSLPKNQLRVRMFCIIPLFMAIESYIKCVGNRDVFASGQTVKISRLQVQDIVAKSTLWAASNDALINWFFASMDRAHPRVRQSVAVRSLMRLQAAQMAVRTRN